ncbi:MAG: hypothetical protein JKY54_11085 [Flavobacteriales bacterium]|nr:hypothetical protein [Flavobacteriales bacterium]
MKKEYTEIQKNNLTSSLWRCTLSFMLLIVICISGGSCSNTKNIEPILTASSESADSIINLLIDSAINFQLQGKSFESETKFNEATSLLTDWSDTTLRIHLLFTHTRLLKQRGKYDRCLFNYFEALKLSTLTKDSAKIGLSLYSLSSINYFLERKSEADSLNQRSIDIYSTIENIGGLADAYNQRSVFYQVKGNILMAKNFLQMAIANYTQINEAANLAICFNNFGNLSLVEDDSEKATKYYQNAATICSSLNDLDGLAVAFGNIGQMHLERNNLTSAKLYIDSSMIISKKINSLPTEAFNLERLIDYHILKRNYDLAFSHSNQLLELNAEIMKTEKFNVLIEINTRRANEIKLIEYKAQIELGKKDKIVSLKEQNNEELLMYIIIIITFTLAVVIYTINKKQKAIRMKYMSLLLKEKEALEIKSILALNKIKNQELNKTQLEEELNHKKDVVLSFSKELSERAVFLQQMKSEFAEIKPTKIIKLSKLETIDELFLSYEIEGRKETIHNATKGFIKSFELNIKSKHPDLASEDMGLLSLIIFGLSSKDIATLLSIEPRSVDMRKYRLKKKLGLDSKMSLTSFYLNLE